MLDRAVRWQVAPVSAGAGGLPALLAEAASGTPGPVLRSFARELRSAPPLCVGLLPKCATRDQVALGAVLSSLCPRLAEEKSFFSACRAWGVAVSGDDVGAVDGVPTLALLGAHNPYARVAEARAALQRWVPSAHVVVHARSGHNVLGTDCAREVRTQWLESSDRPPARNPCLREGLVFP
jgi:hypothetical protein